LGRVRYQQNLFDQAISAFQGVLQRDPASVKAQDNLGLSLEAENRVDQAIAAYRKAIELDEASAIHSEQPYLNLGILLTKSAKPEQALPLLAKAAQIDGKSARIHYQLGKAYFDLGRFVESQSELQAAVALTPQDVPSHYLLAQVYRHLGNRDLAKEQFKMAETLLQASKSHSTAGGMASSTDRP
jgi:tetratricopeptide (TPR) repeat protein